MTMGYVRYVYGVCYINNALLYDELSNKTMARVGSRGKKMVKINK